MVELKIIDDKFVSIELKSRLTEYDYQKFRACLRKLPVSVIDNKAKSIIIPIKYIKESIFIITKEYGFKLITKEYKKLKGFYKETRENIAERMQIKNTGVKKGIFNTISAAMNVLNYDLYSFQVLGSYFTYLADNSFILDDVGLGKTVQSLAVIEKRFIDESINFCIVLCPSTLKKNWEEKIKLFSNRDIYLVSGHKAKRKNIYKKTHRVDYLILNYDLLRHDFDLIKEFIIERNFKFNIIYDEMQYLKNKYAERTKLSLLLSKYAKYQIGLSATLLENSVLDLFGPFSIIDYSIFGNTNDNYNSFAQNYCKFNFMGKAVGTKNINKLTKIIDPYYIRRFKEDVANDLPPVVEKTIWIELSPKQRKVYNDVSEKVLSDIADLEKKKKINNATVLSLMIYLRQCVLSTMLIGHDEDISTKSEELINLISQISKRHKVLIFCHFTGMVELLYERIKKHNYNVEGMHGSKKGNLHCPMDDRIEKVNRWDNDDKSKVMITSDILREGADFLNTSYLINFDQLYNPARMKQRKGRIDRINSKCKSLTVLNLVADNTIEVDMVDIGIEKQQISTDVLDKGRIEKRVKKITITNLKSMIKSHIT